MVTYVLSLVGIFVLSLIINALAPSFGGQKNSAQALKVAVYSYTPAWVAGVLTILTSLGILAIIASFYGLYLLYLGPAGSDEEPEGEVGRLHDRDRHLRDRACGWSSARWAPPSVAPGCSARGGLAGLPHAGGASPSGAVQFDKDSFLGRMQAMGQAAQESSKKMEEAQKSGDPNAQAQAAMQGLGAILGGGKHVDPIGIDQLKPFVPTTFAGLDKTGGSAEKNGMAGLAVSKAEGTYSDHAKKHVTLEITDTGGASGLIGLAGWMNMQGEREDDNGFEKTDKVDGRLTHEKGSKRPGGSNEFTVVLGDRFIVAARGTGVELPELKSAVAGLDLGKLEALKSVGVQK